MANVAEVEIVVAPAGSGVQLALVDPSAAAGPVETLDWDQAAERVRDLEQERPRWIWADTRALAGRLLERGVVVERCRDLQLSHAILASSPYASFPADEKWRAIVGADESEPTLLESNADTIELADVVGEYHRQERAVQASTEPGRLRLLLAAESAGALVASELKHFGLPWDADVHDQQLSDLLGPKPILGGRPAKLESLVTHIRTALDAPGLNPDSQPELLRALRSRGHTVTSTRHWELEQIDDPAIAPLLEYKKLARLLAANGWAWMAAWVRDGRFHPDYVPGGVVTGRWATRGGGALQVPKQIRAAVRADPGWRLVVADAAQLEPRILAAMSSDQAMAKAAGRGDLYQALVDEGVVDTRAHAKVGMLAALYGATAGESGQLMPRLARAFPQAIGLVEAAARTGERGEVVHTWLGRGSPPGSERWQAIQRQASLPEASEADQRRARQSARDWGRFTRNFIVQGTAAEWALCWLAGLRTRLAVLGPAAGDDTARPRLAYFLHDEVIVHTPAEQADQVAEAVAAAAQEAGRLLFGAFPIEFALDVAIVENYAGAT